MNRLFARLAFVAIASLCTPAFAEEPPGFENIDPATYDNRLYDRLKTSLY